MRQQYLSRRKGIQRASAFGRWSRKQGGLPVVGEDGAKELVARAATRRGRSTEEASPPALALSSAGTVGWQPLSSRRASAVISSIAIKLDGKAAHPVEDASHADSGRGRLVHDPGHPVRC